MIVKICGITNREDAQVAVDGGVTALGFIFYEQSPRYIAPEHAARIIERLPTGVWKVGLFVNVAPAEVVRIRKAAGLDIVQLQGDEPPEDLPAEGRVWKTMHVDGPLNIARMDAYRAEAFLLDTPSEKVYGGTGRTFDWSKAAGTGRRIVLAGGLDAENVRAAIRQVRPWGVDACSRLESSPGRKDHVKMARFLKAALSEAAE
jgi:phosphoribosylanthranilate isomerase